ncbi:hypothetical protein LTR27_010250 [Elasticomyces elasticus]|nr:hypothetical protein LTR27_010250 [Elasticomyces elasticus]
MDSSFKTEIKPEIKVDPGSPSNLANIEAFEDDIDTSFPDAAAQAWLVKTPEDLWKAWADIYKDAPDNTPIEVGKLRLYHQPPGKEDPKTQKIQIRLHQHTPQFQSISKQYNLAVTTGEYSNVVVFSEKDVPGQKPQQYGRNRPGAFQQAGSKPTGIPGRNGVNKPGRSRSAIPKQTSLAPRIQHEATATPIIDAEYEAAFARSWAAHVAPKSHTTFLNSVDRSLHPGLTSNLNSFSSFGLSSRPGRGGKRAAGGAVRSKDKNVRMPKSDLLDALQGCFRRYRYWSLKTLRTELQQPEAWIKEVLEDIAVLVRSGDFAMNYTLREDMMGIVLGEGVGQGMEEVAKVESPFGDDGGDTGMDGTGDELDDGDDDLGGFEDVKMEGGL